MLHKNSKSRGSFTKTWRDVLEPGEAMLPTSEVTYQIPVLHTVMSLASTEYSPKIFTIVCAIRTYENFILKQSADNGQGDMLSHMINITNSN